MKASDFQIGAGEYQVVATYENYNDATQQTEVTTIRTHERPRSGFFSDLADLAFKARDYFELGELKLVIKKVGFTANDDGRFVRLNFETSEGLTIRIQPPRVNRNQDIKPGEDAPDPESKKNIFLDAVDKIENRITEYLNGDREQPELPIKAEPEKPAKRNGIFNFGRS